MMSENVKKILLIDDEPLVTSTMTTMLKAYTKHEVITANSGKEGIKEAIKHSPDLIFLDIMMPDINGIDVLKELKEKSETCMIPIIMLTALGDAEMMQSAMHAYAQRYIEKPIDKETLLSVIKGALG
ncbi:PleD family two-component system response regulator [Verrucomicrobiota bacterium]